jgi:hypothetical protein
VLSVKVIASKGAAASKTPSDRFETKLADHNLLNALPIQQHYRLNNLLNIPDFFT